MAISLDAIYQPLNQFFLQKFGQGDGISVFFRFAQIPVGFYDSDFLIPSNPELGPSPALATEQLSNLVDRITRLDPSGNGVWLDSPRISDLYHDEILNPSFPFIPTDADADAKQAVIDAFNQIKSDAISRWENCKAASLISSGTLFRPANATPQGWWNKSDPGVWTPQVFHIEGAATAEPEQPRYQLLRMKISDSALKPMLESHMNLAAAEVSPPVVRATDRVALHRPVMLSRPSLLTARPMFAATLARSATATRPPVHALRLEPEASVTAAPTRPELTKLSVAMHSDLRERSTKMPLRQRMELQAVLSQSAPTQSVAVTDVTITFDYCLVTVARAWIHNAFLNNKSWFIPGQRKSCLSANDGHGVPALPAGFIALKNLRIEGPWTPADISNLALSDQFGPFLIDSTVENGAIGHAGIQVVGWILQDMPDLPPLDNSPLP